MIINNDSSNDITFFKVWRNIVINTIIYKYSRLYIKNKFVVFNDLKSLREYKEREFITTIVLSNYDEDDEEIYKGDLPENCVLKEVNLTSSQNSIYSCDVIPLGVEIIHFNATGRIKGIQITELPPTVHTVTNLLLKKPYSNYQIPNNITSLSIHSLTDHMEFCNIIIPNSVITLGLNLTLYYRLPFPPPLSFIPQSVTDLSMYYDERWLSNLPVIPSSVTKLHLNISGNCYFNCGVIPFGVKELTLHCTQNNGSANLSATNLPTSITKLTMLNK